MGGANCAKSNRRSLTPFGMTSGFCGWRMHHWPCGNDYYLINIRRGTTECGSAGAALFQSWGTVRARGGLLVGIEGILERRKNQFRMVLPVDILLQTVAVEVTAADVDPAAVKLPYFLALYRLAGTVGDSLQVIHLVVTAELSRWPECWIEFMQ